MMTADTSGPPVSRIEEIDDWLTRQIGPGRGPLVPIAGDAGPRRYFRVSHAGGTRVVMDAVPGADEVHRFLRTADLLRAAGVHAPEVYAAAPDRGLVLLEDLGERDYLAGFARGEGDRLMPAALRALVRWQAASRSGVLPPYDEALLRRELGLFPEWYLQRHRGIRLNARDLGAWECVCDALVARALAQPQVYVHRDYMARNLMVCEGLPGVIDHQDAVYGPLAYDFAALLRDAFWEWPAPTEDHWIGFYLAEARAAGLPVPHDEAFRQDLDWMAVQRHLKILGLFARLYYRDGKSRYLPELPRFARFVRREAAPWAALSPLLSLFDRHGVGEESACGR